jgi:gliding motility-associated-like protein
LLAYWPFSGNTNDQTTNANHLTNNGATLVADRNGTANAAYSFNGAGNYLEKTIPSFVFSPSGTFSISFWLNRPSTTGGVAMMSGSGTANNFIWLFSGNSNNNVFGTNKQQSAWIWANSPYSLNQWEHYVCMYINGVMRVYRNGVLEVSATYTHTGALATALPFYIGKDIGTSYFNGSIDDVAIWNRSLTNCEIQKMYTSQLPNIVSNAGADFTVCKGDTITLSGTGTGGNTYNWNLGITNNNPFVINTTTTYTYTAVGPFSCTVADQIVVTVNQPQVNGGPNQSVCAGTAVTLTGTGSTALTWTNNVLNGIAFTPDSTQTYTVSGTDANGCFGTDQVVVAVNTPLINAGQDVTICLGQSTTLSASGGTSYIWTPTLTNGQAVSPTQTTTYAVIGTDSNGCENTSDVTVTVIPVPIASFTANEVTGAPGSEFTFTNTSSNATSYNWNFGNGSQSTTTNLGTESEIYVNEGIYIVTLNASNGICDDNETLTITIVVPILELFIPNVFTADDNTVNETWSVQTKNAVSANVLIFNRWGNVIAELKEPNESWDGTVNGKQASAGVYFYKYELVDNYNEKFTGHGHFTLIRD